MNRELLKGNEAIAEAAVRAGLEAYFGYPITPQTELLEHLARRLPSLTENFYRVSEHIEATRPDLVINSGDLSFDPPTSRHPPAG